MSEGSLPPFKLRFLRSSLRRNLGRLSNLFRRESASREDAPEIAASSPGAEAAIRAHAEDHAALFERAARLREKSDRLDREGTPSESARNRARRAEEEVEYGLRSLRSSFAANGGEEARITFDQEVTRRFPRLKTSGE